MLELKKKSDWHTEAEARDKACAAPRLRILIVAPSLDILGGQAVQAKRLLERLQQEPSLEVSFLPVNPPMPGFLKRVQHIKYIRSVRTTLLYWAALSRHVR